jgi:carboxyl-terminal processing protease
MSSRFRLTLLLVSAPLVLLIVIGGFLSKASARGDTAFAHLKVFDDVTTLVLQNYVESVDSDHIMKGAMQGLAEGLDPDSAYLTSAQVATFTRTEGQPTGSVGLELTRQYYLRVIAARDGSPAAKAGLRPGDLIRAIDDTPTRDLSVLVGSRLLRGAPGSKVTLTIIRGNAMEPHTVELTRETPGPVTTTGQPIRPGIGLVRVPSFTPATTGELREQVSRLTRDGATRVLIDLRGTAEGAIDDGIAAARLFVGSGVLAIRESRSAAEAKGTNKTPIESSPGDGTFQVPVTILSDIGTSGAAEVFSAALLGNGRATLVGEHTSGRAALQELVKLPDGSGLWLSTTRFLTPKEAPIHEKGLTPDVLVESPDVEFGAPMPTADPILDKALEPVAQKPAA